MQNRKYIPAVCLVSVIFLIIGSWPVFVVDKIVKRVIAMECECVATVTRAGIAIQNIPGVLNDDVNRFTLEATVKFDDIKTNVEKITEGLTEQNFPVF